MYLEKLDIINYRNYEKMEKNFSPHINVLIGNNAQGKTNIVEAIYYLAIGRAYRPAREAQLIRWQQQYFRIASEVKNKHGQVTLEIKYYEIPEKIQGIKEIKINGLKINKLSDFFGSLTAVLFAPEDLNIIKGAPQERRKLLDNDISQVSSGYYLKLQQYNRLLTQRNHLLKKIARAGHNKQQELEIWNQQFIEAGSILIDKRLQVLEKLMPLTRLMQRKLTSGQENLEIRYILNKQTEIKAGALIRDLLWSEMEKYKEEELRRGVTLFGPHRDDLSLFLNGCDLKYYGSQGQHRTTVLAIKLAELEFFRAETGEYPILLLDDVMSELDQERREHLLQIIKEKAIQCFVTTTEDVPEKWESKIPIKKFIVQQGALF